LHIDEIAKKVNVDPSKLGVHHHRCHRIDFANDTSARILRLLATHHIFSEVEPNVFANNRISAILEKGQSVEALLEK
jgi:hypothetical protein